MGDLNGSAGNGAKVTVSGDTIAFAADPDNATIDAGAAGSKLRVIPGVYQLEAPIVTKNSNYGIGAGDARKCFTGAVDFTLPAAVALPVSGIPFRVGFMVPAAGTMNAIAASGDSIQYGPLASAIAGRLSGSQFGTVFWLANIGLHQWIVEFVTGTPPVIRQ